MHNTCDKGGTVIFICSAKSDSYYPRNAQVLNALKRNFRVINISSKKNFYFLRIPEVLLRYLFFALSNRGRNIVYAGFLAQPLVPFLRMLCKGSIVLDGFVSVYDTLCLDRGDFKPHSLVGRISFFLDRASFSLSDKIITDTFANADFFSGLFGIKRDKFEVVYVSAEESVFLPQHKPEGKSGFVVFFHSTFWPLHGIEYILEAAKLLSMDKEIRFRILGRGRRRKYMQRLSRRLGLENTEFIDWVSYRHLASEITEADICLGGHFSSIPKAARVIAGKTFQYLAMKKPVIVADNPANREVFTHGRDVYMCKAADAVSLAEAVRALKSDDSLREGISSMGQRLFNTSFSEERSAEKFREIIEAVGRDRKDKKDR